MVETAIVVYREVLDEQLEIHQAVVVVVLLHHARSIEIVIERHHPLPRHTWG
jgi:hypothetical protein